MSNIVDSSPLVPVIQKEEFDNVAKTFLEEFYPNALTTPMPIPIMWIAQKRLGLKVCTKYRLSEDFSILGQMCFTSGYVDVYIRETDEFQELAVRRGTMFIDADVIENRNEGCFNNTVAHECVHWYKHRNYHLLQQITEAKKSKYRRCPVESPSEGNQGKWSDEDWMEWQANGIAPRILMPKEMFIQSALNFRSEWQQEHDLTIPAFILRDKLAAFYEVSKQSAQIRMDELGILI